MSYCVAPTVPAFPYLSQEDTSIEILIELKIGKDKRKIRERYFKILCSSSWIFIKLSLIISKLVEITFETLGWFETLSEYVNYIENEIGI